MNRPMLTHIHINANTKNTLGAVRMDLYIVGDAHIAGSV